MSRTALFLQKSAICFPIFVVFYRNEIVAVSPFVIFSNCFSFFLNEFDKYSVFLVLNIANEISIKNIGILK